MNEVRRHGVADRSPVCSKLVERWIALLLELGLVDPRAPLVHHRKTAIPELELSRPPIPSPHTQPRRTIRLEM
jgi:hypothetical protein